MANGFTARAAQRPPAMPENIWEIFTLIWPSAPALTWAPVLLDVPSFAPDGTLRMGGSVENLLAQLPPDVTVCGGNLDHPALDNYRCIDFLKDAQYQAENAYITAECAVEIALSYLPMTLRQCPRAGDRLGTHREMPGADSPRPGG